jgi:hypothetical protein
MGMVVASAFVTLLPESPITVHAARQHVDCGPGGGHPGGHLGHRNVRRAFEYRHAIRLRAGFAGRNRAAQEAAGASAFVPRAVRAVIPHHFDCVLRGADIGPAAGDVDPVLRVAGDRIGDLLSV